LFQELFQHIPQEQHSILFAYEEKEQAQLAFVVEMMYKQGLIDGVYLNRRWEGMVYEDEC